MDNLFIPFAPEGSGTAPCGGDGCDGSGCGLSVESSQHITVLNDYHTCKTSLIILTIIIIIIILTIVSHWQCYQWGHGWMWLSCIVMWQFPNSMTNNKISSRGGGIVGCYLLYCFSWTFDYSLPPLAVACPETKIGGVLMTTPTN